MSSYGTCSAFFGCMTVQLGPIKVEFAQAKQKIGATFTRPDGSTSYDEYTTIKEAMDRARDMARKAIQ